VLLTVLPNLPLDMTPWVGDRLLLNPRTQCNTNTEKAVTYQGPSSEIRKNEAVVWFRSIVLSKDTCIHVVIVVRERLLHFSFSETSKLFLQRRNQILFCGSCL